MALGPERFVQRCAVTGSSGEAATLTFHLRKEERLEPSYRSISVVCSAIRTKDLVCE